MAEYHQTLVCFLTARRWFDCERVLGKDLVLQKLWADTPSSPEQATNSKEKEANVDRVRVLDFRRMASSTHNLDPNIPFPWVMAGSSPRFIPTLRLLEISSTPRTLILRLQELYLQIVIQGHVLCQPFNKDQWDLEISKVSKEARGFAVCIGLDFGDAGVLSFLAAVGQISVQIHWETTIKDLPCQAPDVYTDYPRFLRGVAEWILSREISRGADATCLAVTAIQDAESVFGGMGPYTVNEVYYLAGLSPFLTVHEVFGCPSRTARLCEAFWALAHDAHTTLPAFLNPLYHGYVLAATTEQRSLFARYLHVHAQSRAYMSPRMKTLRDQYVNTVQSRTAHPERPFLRNGIGGLFDVFEPTLIQAALDKPAPVPRLAHLIFGPIEWRVNGGKIPSRPDPLTMAFKKLGVPPDVATNLELPRYRSQLFLPKEHLTKASSPVDLYQGNESPVSLWTITPRIPFDVVTTFHTGRKSVG
ncbi:uncharacterized protein PHACADRAFT_199370 [Phanerochaete carnosa HHB-10118-sp]|uniref:Uncharacterized protein n=1 Tax=Phanerochaete carnosa (strain HHB-10118-sp) TaxID=650164 RepID=K5VKF8_PHACS|nr:uncharacterized protein PHACADRAFT_199370 [Phanerochaete carnosa HHB-10118-sp]EKM51863.1 hypothetical protein PHACADRAFT_199370 [Phanerochaete carnosa HHB-10118-sp]